MNESKVQHIMQFPDEILLEIFVYVRDHSDLVQTCRRFNEISCESKLHTLKVNYVFDKRQQCGTIEIFDNESLFESLLNSRRRIKSLVIFVKGGVAKLEKNHEKQLSNVIHRHGRDIKKLTLINIHLRTSTIKLLNLMPNLEKIKLKSIRLTKYKDFLTPQLRLYKLTEIDSNDCLEEVLSGAFDGLPEGVLRKVTMICYQNFQKVDRSIKLFGNQSNIEELSTPIRFVKLMNMKLMNVKSLQLLSKVNIARCLEDLPGLTSLSVDVLLDGELSFICKKLQFLEKLNIQEANRIEKFEFSELCQLKRLKELALSFYLNEEVTNESIARINAKNVVDLNIRCCAKAFDSTIVALCTNVSQLRKLKFTANELSSNAINILLGGLQELECLEIKEIVVGVATSDYVFPEGLKHERLTKLTIVNSHEYNENWFKLLQCCTNLRELSTRFYSLPSTNFLAQLLIALPNVEILRLTPAHDSHHDQDDMLAGYATVLKNYGGNLQHFSYFFYSRTSDVRLESLQKTFGKQFSKISLTSQNLFMTN